MRCEEDMNTLQSTPETCHSHLPCTDVHDAISQTRARVQVKWIGCELKHSGWKPGWYSAQVQSYNQETDEIDIVYDAENDCVYTEELTRLISNSKIKLLFSVK